MSRESDIQSVIEGVLSNGATFYDNPNGGYEYTCPFCYGEVVVGSGGLGTTNMEDIKHNGDCIYLIAKDLNTK
jgi:hypothetical protein